MKAFVIKNKVHGYFGVNNMYQYPEWSSIDLAYYFKTEEEAEKFKNKNYPTCKVVEITIVEGNLEDENRVLKRALELALSNLYYADKEYYIGGTVPSQEEYVEEQMKYWIQQAKKEKKDE